MPEPEPSTPETGTDPKTPAKPETDLAAEVEKWKALSRKNEEQAKANAEAARRLAELEESQKTDQQKLADTNKALEDRARKAELESCRMRVAIRKGLTEAQVKRLLGTTEEELEADADELVAAFKGAEPEATPPATGGRPKEKLRPGAVPEAEPDPDPASVIAAIPRI
jgi:hypothetical protein